MFLSFFCSGSETALFSLTTVKVENLRKKYPKRGNIIFTILSDPQKLLVTILICNILANIVATIIAKKIFNHYLDNPNPLIIIISMTLMVLVFGEVTPKSIAIKVASSVALTVAPIFYFLTIALTPIIFIFRKITSFLVKINSIIFFQNTVESNDYKLDEMIHVVKESRKQNVLSDIEGDIIENIIYFSTTDIWKLLKPRNEIFSFSIDTEISEIIDKVKEKKYSRIPIWEDTDENVVGILLVKELVKLTDYSKKLSYHRNILQKPIFIPESMKAEHLLKFFQTTHKHLALVIDEFGGISGLITLEDILEAIIGEVVDKDDIFPLYHKYNPSMIEVEAKMDIDELNKVFNIELKSADAASVGGYILEQIGRIPQVGEIFVFGSLQFKISGADNHKIEKILITKLRKIRKKKKLFLP